MRLMAVSFVAGGCTFAEDPSRNCAIVRPIWSAAIDPRVLRARAVPATGKASPAFDAILLNARIARGAACEHVLLDAVGGPVRLDVIEGTMIAGPVVLRFDVICDDRLPHQLAAIQGLSQPSPYRRHEQLARKLLSLEAFDTHAAGASLRETARLLLGPGDWPGTGDHRKSLVRRMVAAGARMIAEGPGAVLNGRW